VTSVPLDDFASNGIQTGTGTSNVLFQDVYVHGLPESGFFGPIGGPVTLNRVLVNFNSFAGWNFDDGADTPDLAGSSITANYVTMVGNGCNEEYPIVHTGYPAAACYDLSSGGFGDSWSGQDTVLDSFTCNHCDQHWNTKDGFIGPHTFIKNLTITQNGLPFGQFYGYKVLGIFKTDAQAAAATDQPGAHAGDLIYYHDPKNGSTMATKDQMAIGNPNPKLVYGLTIRLSYRNFDLAALFNGVAGVQLFNGVKAYEQHPFESDANVSPIALKDSYFGSNGLTSQPRMGYTNPNGSYSDDPNGNYNNPSSYFVENGGYIKLKNLQIGYSFSSAAMERLKIRSAR